MADVVGEKQCRNCEAVKAVSDFTLYAHTGKAMTSCKSCMAGRTRERRVARASVGRCQDCGALSEIWCARASRAVTVHSASTATRHWVTAALAPHTEAAVTAPPDCAKR